MKGRQEPVRDSLIVDLALIAGLRVSGLSHLKIEYFYLENDESSLVVRNGKGGKRRLVRYREKDLNELNVNEILLESQVNFSFNLLRDLDFYYLNASTEFKRKILGSIFPENLIYSDKNYRTPNSDSVISLIANMEKVSGDTNMQKFTNYGGQSLLAPREGLEPPT